MYIYIYIYIYTQLFNRSSFNKQYIIAIYENIFFQL